MEARKEAGSTDLRLPLAGHGPRRTAGGELPPPPRLCLCLCLRVGQSPSPSPDHLFRGGEGGSAVPPLVRESGRG